MLSGELLFVMGRIVLFYYSGGSSGYESMMRDSEVIGSVFFVFDFMSDSGVVFLGVRVRSFKFFKKRVIGGCGISFFWVRYFIVYKFGGFDSRVLFLFILDMYSF